MTYAELQKGVLKQVSADIAVSSTIGTCMTKQLLGYQHIHMKEAKFLYLEADHVHYETVTVIKFGYYSVRK